MKPVKFKNAREILGRPKDWNEDLHGPCGGLPVLRANSNIYSCWQPSFKERIKLLFGQPVMLIVAQPITMPPVALEVGEP